MKNGIVKTLCLSIAALLILSTLAVFPVLSGFPPRSYPGAGKGAGTIYVDPQDSNFTSSKPIDNRTGDTFSIDVRIANATFVAGWQVELTYDATMLSTTTTNVSYATDMIFPSGSYSPIAPGVGAWKNATHNYVLMTATTTGAVEYNATDAGLMTVTFTIIADPDPSAVLSCMLYIQVEDGIYETWLTDTDLGFDNTMTILDGYYENRYVPPPPAYLEISPTLQRLPAIAGDRIVGTSRALFSVEILINDVDADDELFFVQLELSYNATLIGGVWIDEGTFMNDAAWADYGTIDNGTIVEAGRMIWWVMLLPNATGYWDHATWPSGDGLLATARLEVIEQYPDSDGVAPEELVASSDLTLSGVFTEFFLGHPNDPDPPYLPYGAPINGQIDIYGYYWRLPEAAFTWTPTTPLPEAVVTFDASASYGWRNDMGSLVADPAVIVNYKWNWGDGKPDNESTSPTMTHVYDLTGEYPVSLTVTDYNGMDDFESKVISIVFGRLIDVFTQYDDPHGGQGLNASSSMFWPQKPVILTAILTYNGDPVQHKAVAFQVISPTGYWNFTRVAFTDADGVAIIYFGLPWPCDDPEEIVFGIWTVIAKADIQCVTCEDWLWFKVYWYTSDLTVTPKETDYAKCETAAFDINFISYSSQPHLVLVTVTVYDDLNVPIGQASAWVLVGDEEVRWCEYKEYNMTLRVHIPKWAYVGKGKVFVNTFFDWPINCGYPLSPEAYAEFGIEKS